MKILVINGPNLNMLGKRDKDIYGSFTYEDLKEVILSYANKCSVEIEFYQSNFEGDIINKLHTFDKYDGIIINPGAYSHYSIAILDALSIANVPKVEVHISNVLEREEYRKTLLTAEGCDKVITGLGDKGYLKAIDYIIGTV